MEAITTKITRCSLYKVSCWDLNNIHIELDLYIFGVIIITSNHLRADGDGCCYIALKSEGEIGSIMIPTDTVALYSSNSELSGSEVLQSEVLRSEAVCSRTVISGQLDR